jgi:hypothetical protein
MQNTNLFSGTIEAELSKLGVVFSGVRELKSEVVRENISRAESLGCLLDTNIPDNTPIRIVRSISSNHCRMIADISCVGCLSSSAIVCYFRYDR